MDEVETRRVLRTTGCVALVAVALFYFQFGLQAIGQWLPQAALVFLGVIALGVGASRMLNGREAARIVGFGTAPLWILQIAATALVEDESPAFIVVTGVVPLTAAIVWLTHRRPREHVGRGDARRKDDSSPNPQE